jgi:hypothetical protein
LIHNHDLFVEESDETKIKKVNNRSNLNLIKKEKQNFNNKKREKKIRTTTDN